jgi:hypothetical protein
VAQCSAYNQAGFRLILRTFRSAGFGQAFLAIVLSERGDHGDTSALLRIAAKELLLCAGASSRDFVKSSSSSASAEEDGADTASAPATPAANAAYYEELFKLPPVGRDVVSSASDNWRTRVHALNIVRLLFKDSQVSVLGS